MVPDRARTFTATPPTQWVPSSPGVDTTGFRRVVVMPRWGCGLNCAGLHTIVQSRLTTRIGEVGDETLERVCSAVSYALGL
jgi:mRNA-degrading endonuclease toxin of MazEF toxin-antitoxin module